MDDLQKYIHISKYAKFNDSEGRRETWEETVNRYVNFFEARNPSLIIGDFKAELFNVIHAHEVMPSMRCLMSAGKALARDNAAGYNCAGAAILDPKYFDELFYLLMCGCGDGFSVERQFINTDKMPSIPEILYDTDTVITVKDSKIGWASALRELISLLYAGKVPKWDLSKVRPAGARLKTFGGRASGPEPLNKLFLNTVRLFKKAAGRKLNSLECHDLWCYIASAVIVGSVRRSAGISFSNLSDDRMRGAKYGDFGINDPQRYYANNSVMYTERPDLEAFTKEFRSMYKSRSGERGMVNQEALKRKAVECGREHGGSYLLNPCGEAILRDTGGLCNLTEVVVRSTDTLDDLKRKVKYATILGTLQSTLTDFRYLRKIWKDNAEEERLLGVSLTGIMDHPVLSGRGEWDTGIMHTFCGDEDMSLAGVLHELKNVSRDTNEEWARKLGINPSKQLTLVKPSGTVSLLVNSSSGIHPRFAGHYVRKVTQDMKDPLTDLMIAEGIPHTPDPINMKVYFSFPVKAPEGAVLQKDMGAMEQLELWKVYQKHWCEGNPSQTIYYTDRDFLDVQAWVWRNWDDIGGLSFFPVSDHIYENAPMVEISEGEYNTLMSIFPTKVKWDRLSEYEGGEDFTTTEQTMACAGGQCDL